VDATLAGGLALVAVAWAVLFALPAAGFWRRVVPAGVTIGVYGAVAERHRLDRLLGVRAADAALGAVAAAALYGVFLALRLAVPRVSGALDTQVDHLYRLGDRAEPRTLPAVLVVVAVSEELFWRGFVQHRAGFAVALAGYVLVLVWARVPALLGAAALAGACWGGLVAWQGTLVAAAVCHVLWDLAVMRYLPLRRSHSELRHHHVRNGPVMP